MTAKSYNPFNWNDNLEKLDGYCSQFYAAGDLESLEEDAERRGSQRDNKRDSRSKPHPFPESYERPRKSSRSRATTKASSGMLCQPLMCLGGAPNATPAMAVPGRVSDPRRSSPSQQPIEYLRSVPPSYYSSSPPQKTASGGLGCCCFLVLLLAAGAIGFYFGQEGVDTVSSSMQSALSTVADHTGYTRPTLEQFRQEAPFNMTQPEDADRWPNEGHGLEMTLQFAASPRWYKYFARAVEDWGNCSSLSLVIENTTVDPDCAPVDGVIKFCNKDWGATGWNGINYAMVSDDGYITSSTANMNEHYLKWTLDPQKQYVACHEIGHGFGLPHTDESFWNRPTGSCLDYVTNPRGNTHPNQENYDYLYQLYGSFDSTTPTAAPNADATSAPTVSPTIEPTNENRRLQTNGVRNSQPSGRVLFNKWKSAISDHISNFDRTAHRRLGWRLVHVSGFGEQHEFDLGGGYTIRANVLLAQP